jgi:outer membrane protein assembly factor BamB
MTEQTTYPMVHGSPRRDCALKVPVKGLSKVIWTAPLNMERADFFPKVLIWEGNPVACALSAFCVYTKDGKELFRRDKHPGSPVAIATDLAYHENRGTYLEAVDLHNKLVLERGSFAVAPNGEFNVTLFWPRENDYIGCSFSPYYEEVVPSVIVRRGSYTERLGIWGEDFKGPSQLWPLAVPEMGLLLVSINNTVICMNIEGPEEVGRFQVSLQKMNDWSSDPKGGLCILGECSDNKVLVGMSSAGKELWRLDIKGDDQWVLWQPPIQAGDGRVYVLTDHRVLAIQNGALLWQYGSKDGEVHGGSSVPDGSVLVASGQVLMHLGTDGKVLERVAVGEEVLSAPVVDLEGFVYVMTKSQIIKIGN